MEGNTLVFSGSDYSTGNTAIAALMAQMRTVRDSRGNRVWQFIGRGIGQPDYGSATEQQSASDLREDQSPGIILWEHQDDHVSTTTVWVDGELRIHVSLKCYVYLPGTENGLFPDVQDFRRNITKATLRALRPKSVDNPTGWVRDQYPFWIWEPQTVSVDYADNVSNQEPSFKIVPPWWAWRIDITMAAWNINPPVTETMVCNFWGAIEIGNLAPLYSAEAITFDTTQSVADGTCTPIIVAGTFTRMRVDSGTPAAGASDTYTLIVNGNPTAIAATIAIGESSAVDNEHSVHVNVGDLVSTKLSASAFEGLTVSISYFFIPDSII